MKKDKIVLIAGSVFPMPSATGSICLKIAQVLSEKYDVEILSLMNTFCKEKTVIQNGVKIHIAATSFFKLRRKYEKKNGIFNKAIFRSVQVMERVKSLLFVPKNTWWYADYIKNSIPADTKCVITFSEPFESHWGMLRYKAIYPDVRWIASFMDMFAAKVNKKNIFYTMDTMLKMEEEIYKHADAVFVTPEIMKARGDFLKEFARKTTVIPYIVEPLDRKQEIKHQGTHAIYAGRFYKDIRRPEKMLDFFVELRVTDFFLDIYSEGECADIVSGYAKNNDWIVQNRMVGKDELIRRYSETDIFINLENNVCEFKPSKQYEYISTGKPIISFYYFSPDEALAKYPLALQIDMNHIEKYTEEARRFISVAKGCSVNSEEIEKIYGDNSLSHVVQMIESKIGRNKLC